MRDEIRKKLVAKTAGHLALFEEALTRANAKARVAAEEVVQKLYELFRDAVPSIPEIAISENTSPMGLPMLSCGFRRADGDRYLTLTPIRYLNPREQFEGHPASDPFAVLVVEIRSNSRQVQIGYLTLRLTARTETDLLADHPSLQWEVSHLVNENSVTRVDKALVERLIERAFIQDKYGND